MKKALFVVATVSAAPALTFDRPASTKVNYGRIWDSNLGLGQVWESVWFGFQWVNLFFRKMLHLCHFNKNWTDQTEKISSRITLLKMETPNIMLNSTTTLVNILICHVLWYDIHVESKFYIICHVVAIFALESPKLQKLCTKVAGWRFYFLNYMIVW